MKSEQKQQKKNNDEEEVIALYSMVKDYNKPGVTTNVNVENSEMDFLESLAYLEARLPTLHKCVSHLLYIIKLLMKAEFYENQQKYNGYCMNKQSAEPQKHLKQGQLNSSKIIQEKNIQYYNSIKYLFPKFIKFLSYQKYPREKNLEDWTKRQFLSFLKENHIKVSSKIFESQLANNNPVGKKISKLFTINEKGVLEDSVQDTSKESLDNLTNMKKDNLGLKIVFRYRHKSDNDNKSLMYILVPIVKNNEPFIF